jgi:hypothetical protein
MMKMLKWAILSTVIISPFLVESLEGIAAWWLLIGPAHLFLHAWVALSLISVSWSTVVWALCMVNPVHLTLNIAHHVPLDFT